MSNFIKQIFFFNALFLFNLYLKFMDSGRWGSEIFDIFTIIIYQNQANINVKVFFLAFNVYCNVGYQGKKLIFVFFFSKISTWIFGIYYILKKINLFIYLYFFGIFECLHTYFSRANYMYNKNGKEWQVEIYNQGIRMIV